VSTWYSAKLLFESAIDGEAREQPLCEESIRILLEENEESARAKAEAIGRGAEHEYQNDAGEIVSWRFVSVLEVQDLSAASLEDGTEVFSTLFRKGGDATGA
jgi:hypothetical protein